MCRARGRLLPRARNWPAPLDRPFAAPVPQTAPVFPPAFRAWTHPTTKFESMGESPATIATMVPAIPGLEVTKRRRSTESPLRFGGGRNGLFGHGSRFGLLLFLLQAGVSGSELVLEF